MAAEGSSVRSRGKGFCYFSCCADCANRHSAAKTFCHGYDIRFDAVVHVRHYRTGSAPAGLYFINQKQHVVLITELPESLHELFRCRMNTAFALYRLNHDGDGVFGTCIFEGLQIIIRCVGESVGHRSESNLASVARLTGCRHGTEGSSMEAHLCGYDVVTVRAVFLDAVLSCHFDHGLVRLGTGVLIEDLVHADGLADFLSKQCLRDGVWIVEGMHDIVELLFCCSNNFRVSVSGVVYGDACVKVKIRRSVFVVHVHPLCGFCKEIETLVGLDHVLVYFVFDVLNR